ncbi:hypothetical protein Tco_1148587 [Tanacetum coccineum]
MLDRTDLNLANNVYAVRVWERINGREYNEILYNDGSNSYGKTIQMLFCLHIMNMRRCDDQQGRPTMPPRRVRRTNSPRRSGRAAVERLIATRVAEAIVKHERNRPNPADVGGAGNVQGCMHKTFMNGKPHPFNGTEGVVGLRRWIEKVEHVFEIFKCVEEDKVKFTASTFEGRALTWWNGNVHTLGLVNANRIP